jgi:hypothetical protein
MKSIFAATKGFMIVLSSLAYRANSFPIIEVNYFSTSMSSSTPSFGET